MTGTAAGEIDCRILVPPGYDEEPERRYAVLYLLHGRTDSADDWVVQAFPALQAAMVEGELAPLLAVAVDAPWSDRSSWWVDSLHDSGSPVKSAITNDVVAAIDAEYRTVADRDSRLLAGYSMGGAGVVDWLLSRPELFSAGVALSPAVYLPLPGIGSNARVHGAFGRAELLFDDERYLELGYSAALARFDPAFPVRLLIAVGDREWMAPASASVEEAEHDLVFESARLFNRVRRVRGIDAELRVLDGGHDWTFWRAALLGGLGRIAPGPAASA